MYVDKAGAMSYVIVTPPSITMVWPVIQFPARDARNTAAPAISSGTPILRNGVLVSALARVSGFSHRARAKSVFTSPGAMQFARILCGPHSIEVVALADVAGHWSNLQAFGAQAVGHLRALVRLAAGDDHFCSGARQGFGDGQSNSSR